MKNKTLNRQEMSQITGGEDYDLSAIWSLILQAWNNTPTGGSSVWVNRNDGCFDGEISIPNCECHYSGVICA